MMADSSRQNSSSRDLNEFSYVEENGVNLREHQNTNNLGLCEDDLFEDLFPSRTEITAQVDLCKDGKLRSFFQKTENTKFGRNFNEQKKSKFEPLIWKCSDSTHNLSHIDYMI